MDVCFMPLDCSCTSIFPTNFYLCDYLLCMSLCFDAMIEFQDVEFSTNVSGYQQS